MSVPRFEVTSRALDSDAARVSLLTQLSIDLAPGDDTDPSHLYEQDARVSLVWKPSSHRAANVSLTGRFIAPCNSSSV